MRTVSKIITVYFKHFFGIWNEPTRYRQLYSRINEIRAKNIMEIGTWRGKRARLMILEAQKYHPPQEVSYYGFDLFETMPPEEMAKALETLKEECFKRGCTHIIAVTNNPAVAKIAENYGAYIDTRMIWSVHNG